MNPQKLFVGIDVAKNRLDVAVLPSGEVKPFAHTHEGLRQLTDYVLSLAPALIVLEATGGLPPNRPEQPLCRSASRGCRQSPAGPGLRQGHRNPGQNRSNRCPHHRPVRRGRPA
jgi:hypothetical protein